MDLRRSVSTSSLSQGIIELLEYIWFSLKHGAVLPDKQKAVTVDPLKLCISVKPYLNKDEANRSTFSIEVRCNQYVALKSLFEENLAHGLQRFLCEMEEFERGNQLTFSSPDTNNPQKIQVNTVMFTSRAEYLSCNKVVSDIIAQDDWQSHDALRIHLMAILSLPSLMTEAKRLVDYFCALKLLNSNFWLSFKMDCLNMSLDLSDANGLKCGSYLFCAEPQICFIRNPSKLYIYGKPIIQHSELSQKALQTPCQQNVSDDSVSCIMSLVPLYDEEDSPSLCKQDGDKTDKGFVQGQTFIHVYDKIGLPRDMNIFLKHFQVEPESLVPWENFGIQVKKAANRCYLKNAIESLRKCASSCLSAVFLGHQDELPVSLKRKSVDGYEYWIPEIAMSLEEVFTRSTNAKFRTAFQKCFPPNSYMKGHLTSSLWQIIKPSTDRLLQEYNNGSEDHSDEKLICKECPSPEAIISNTYRDISIPENLDDNLLGSRNVQKMTENVKGCELDVECSVPYHTNLSFADNEDNPTADKDSSMTLLEERICWESYFKQFYPEAFQRESTIWQSKDDIHFIEEGNRQDINKDKDSSFHEEECHYIENKIDVEYCGTRLVKKRSFEETGATLPIDNSNSDMDDWMNLEDDLDQVKKVKMCDNKVLSKVDITNNIHCKDVEGACDTNIFQYFHTEQTHAQWKDAKDLSTLNKEIDDDSIFSLDTKKLSEMLKTTDENVNDSQGGISEMSNEFDSLNISQSEELEEYQFIQNELKATSFPTEKSQVNYLNAQDEKTGRILRGLHGGHSDISIEESQVCAGFKLGSLPMSVNVPGTNKDISGSNDDIKINASDTDKHFTGTGRNILGKYGGVLDANKLDAKTGSFNQGRGRRILVTGQDFLAIGSIGRGVQGNDSKVSGTDRNTIGIDRDIPQNDRDIPVNDRDIPRTDRVVPETDSDVPETDKDLLGTDRVIPKTDRDISETDRDVLRTDRDVPETNRNVTEADRDIGLPGTDRVIPQTDRDVLSADRDIPGPDRIITGTNSDIPRYEGDILKTDQEVPGKDNDDLRNNCDYGVPILDKNIPIHVWSLPETEKSISRIDSNNPGIDKDFPEADKGIPKADSQENAEDDWLDSLKLADWYESLGI